MNSPIPGRSFSSSKSWLLPTLIILGVILSYLFFPSFQPPMAHFANDGPLGAQVANQYKMPGAFFAIWNDLYWVGLYNGNFSPNITGILLYLLGPIAYNKLSVPLSLLILGFCAAFFFRTLGFRSAVCVLGGLAAALNMNFFSNACWGLPSRATCLAAIFLALSAVHSSSHRHSLFKSILAGLAIGLAITEGGDNGAIFSLFVASYAFWREVALEKLSPLAFAKGVAKVGLMALFAALMAAQILNFFTKTAVEGIQGTSSQSVETKSEQWDKATQWSLPPIETMRVIIPGFYGYRMDTPDGGEYWGRVGEYPPQPKAMARYSGAGEYAGVIVVLVAIWAMAQSCRKTGGAFSPLEKKMIWAWGAMAGIALVLSWGRHAPFYQFVYALPYFSTIRNPMKFMHPLHMILMIQFAYGLEGLWRLYADPVTQHTGSFLQRIQSAWSKAIPFEKQWTRIVGGVAGLSFVWYFFSFSGSKGLAATIAALPQIDPASAPKIASFHISEIGTFALVFLFSAVALFLLQCRVFAGRKSVWAAVFIGGILVVDMARANQPWIKYYDYTKKYASSPLIEILQDKVPQYRVACIPKLMRYPHAQYGPILESLKTFYDVELLQQQFQYYNIPALDIPQEARMSEEKAAFLAAFTRNVSRLWELTSARYIFGVAGPFPDYLNQTFDPIKQRFKVLTGFTLYEKEPRSQFYGAILTNAGPFAIIEFNGALPRAKLYSHWQISTNGQETLQSLANPTFDPATTVLIADAHVAPPGADTTNATLAPVQFSSYSPKRIELKTTASLPTVLLLNDKWDPGWKASVDGKNVPVLRCNFLMRGVQVPAGDHTVTFQFQPVTAIFYVSSGAFLLGFLLCGLLFYTEVLKPKPNNKP